MCPLGPGNISRLRVEPILFEGETIWYGVSHCQYLSKGPDGDSICKRGDVDLEDNATRSHKLGSTTISSNDVFLEFAEGMDIL